MEKPVTWKYLSLDMLVATAQQYEAGFAKDEQRDQRDIDADTPITLRMLNRLIRHDWPAPFPDDGLVYDPRGIKLVDVPAVPEPQKVTMRGPFTLSDGVLHCKEIRVPALAELATVLRNVDISQANFGTLIVGESNIEKK